MTSYVFNLLIFLPILNSHFIGTLDLFNPEALETVVNQNLSEECRNQFISVANAGAKGDQWALTMLDATAKLQAGFMYGNIFHIGNYDECLEINEKVENQNIQGKYCATIYSPHLIYGTFVNNLFSTMMGNITKFEEMDFMEKVKFSFAFCVPKACSANDLQQFINVLEIKMKSPLHFTFLDDYCDVLEGPSYETSTYVTIAIFSIFGILLVMGTLYDIFVYQQLPLEEKGPNVLVAFSVLTNSKKIFTTASSPDNLGCLNGLRVLSMMWIILGHRYENGYYIPNVNAIKLKDFLDEPQHAMIIAANMAVDTFFVISGLLVMYLFMKSREKGVKFSLPMFYLHRILRLTPSLAMLILFVSTLINYTGSGPCWLAIKEMLVNVCEDKWWSTLIYLQNYINPYKECIGHAWYLAVDTQMYFISPIILFPFIKWPKQTIGAITLYTIASSVYVFWITYEKRLGTIFLNQGEEDFKYIYVPTHVRGTAYLIGMVCGYFLYKIKSEKSLKLAEIQSFLIWFGSLLAMFGIIFWHFSFMSYDYNVWNAAFFNALSRVGWSIFLSFIILLCTNGYGGLINSFLSMNVFTVLIRLNYSIYLLHQIVSAIINGLTRAPAFVSNLGQFHAFCGDYMFSVCIGLIWTLAFESPIITIEKIVFRQNAQKEKSTIVNNGKSEALTMNVYLKKITRIPE